MNTLNTLVGIVSGLGIGSIIGVGITSYVNSKIENKKMLFEARVKAYSNIIGRVLNLFLEPDITVLKEDALIWAKINALLSETFLLGSPELATLIGDFKVKVNQFHTALGNKDDRNSKIIHKELVPLAGKIFDQMRKDVFISNKSIWIKTDLLRKS